DGHEAPPGAARSWNGRALRDAGGPGGDPALPLSGTRGDIQLRLPAPGLARRVLSRRTAELAAPERSGLARRLQGRLRRRRAMGERRLHDAAGSGGTAEPLAPGESRAAGVRALARLVSEVGSDARQCGARLAHLRWGDRRRRTRVRVWARGLRAEPRRGARSR